MRLALFALLHAAFLGVTVLVVPANGQGAAPAGTMSEVPLPGGLRGAMTAIGDRANPDRAQFLAEFIRRTYDTPFGVKADAREPVVQSLVAQLKPGGSATDTIPLPLSQKFWIDVVFRKQATPETLVASIVQLRGAALLYSGLLALDDDTRAWIAEQPSLVSEIVAKRAASFVTVAHGLRISKTGVQVPGGPAAAPVWQALVGRRVNEPLDFVRSLLSSDEGRLAYFFGAMAQLTGSQLGFALSLDASEPQRRIDAGRRLFAVFERLWVGRALDQRVFVRPSFDPALLVAELNPGGDTRLTLPGTRGFWTATFAEARHGGSKSGAPEVAPAITWDQPPDFPWLCEQIFKGEVFDHRRHYMMVLFASRHAAGITKEGANDAVEAIRAVATYPALVSTLERAGVSDLTVFAAAVRRAAALTAIEDEGRARRSVAQYQGALAMIARAHTRSSISAEAATKLVSSLAAIPLSERGDYEGRVVVWLTQWLSPDRSAGKAAVSGPAADGSVEDVYESAGGQIEEDALRVLSGPPVLAPRTLDWEGIRYRIDFARAEAVRLTRSQGQSSRPYLSAARTVLSVADTLARGGLNREIVQQQAQALMHGSQGESSDGSEPPGSEVTPGYRDAAAALQRAARSGDVKAAARLASGLRTVADDLLARGLMEWAYAAALGPRDGISILAADAASRHDFGLRPPGGNRIAVWQLPMESTDAGQRWRVFGSLLGLDVTLANFSLVRLSTKLPPARPTLGEIDRRIFIDTVGLVESHALSDSDRDAITSAIRAGRARLNNVRSTADVRTIAQAVDMSPLRETLFTWTVAHDPSRAKVFLSPAELFWLGAADARLSNLDAWGVPAGPRIGCLCLQVVKGRSWETFAGRWNTGMVASSFPDLNFRLAELLSEMHMPAALLAPALTSATLDFVNSATSRDQDDRRGLVEFVQALQVDKLEQYLSLLTTDGPLVPLGDAPAGKGFTHR